MSAENNNSRLEAFCDGVFAIAMTLLIIDIRLPASTEIHSNIEFWNALKKIAPAIFTFLLSFTIILITWVNHHNGMKLVNKTSSAFLYANGFLLLTVVFFPFPTSLVGEYLLTDHAAPAVVLYEALMGLQAIGWILTSKTAIKGQLGKSEKANSIIRANGQYGYYALVLYTICATIAIWFPLTITIITTLIWIFWLILGIRIKHD